MLALGFCLFILLGILRASWIAIWCLTLIWGNSQSLVFQILAFLSLFLLLWYSHYMDVTLSEVVPPSLDTLFFFFPPDFVPFVYSFGGF